MKFKLPFVYFFVALSLQSFHNKSTEIFDGKTFSGWEGDTKNTWKIKENAVWGGSMVSTVPLNDFLCTKKSYGDFILKLKFKIDNKGGFCNAGVQFRSQRLKNPAHEMTGYQADLGPGYWGALYDESRRDRVLMAPDSNLTKKILKINDWNDYEIIAIQNRIQIKLNGVKTVDYIEDDSSISKFGLIGLQVHGGGKTLAGYKDIFIQTVE